MSTLSEFMARGARPADGRERSRARSTSRGRVVVLRGWREGMDKARVTLLLRDSGVPLAEARNEPASVCLSKGAKVSETRRELDRLGVIL